MNCTHDATILNYFSEYVLHMLRVNLQPVSHVCHILAGSQYSQTWWSTYKFDFTSFFIYLTALHLCCY